MVWMIRLGPLLCTWFSKSAKITGIGNPMIRLSRLMTIVFLIAVMAILVLKNILKYLKIGSATDFP